MTWYRVYYRKGEGLVHGDNELRRAKLKRSPKVIHHEVAKLHECSVCATIGPWTNTWSWYGSYQDLEDGKATTRLCSDSCREAHEVGARSHGGYEPKRFAPGDWRALNQARKAADPRLFPHPKHDKAHTGQGWCRWCGEAVTEKNRRTWHSDCLEQFFLHTRLDAQTAHLCRRDGEHCAICGPGAGKWIDGGPFPSWMGGRDAGLWIRWSQPLEVDHIVELWEVADLPDDERRTYFGPDNLWLLCQQCHRKKSAAATTRRAIAAG